MSKDPSMLNAYDPGSSGALDHEKQALIAERVRLLGPAYRLFYEEPLHFVRGEGVWLFDKSGQAYLDAYNNVASVGHCHPRVVKAIAEQAATLNTHTRYLHETVLEYASALTATMPPALSQAMFTCSGSEANDLALRIARTHTGASGIIVTKLAYHGVTASVSACSPSLGPNVPLGAHVRTVAAPDAYRHGSTAADEVGKHFASAVQAAIDDLLRHGIRPAALLVDTLFTSDGVYAEPAGFLKEAVAVIRAAGGVFIADEVQAGFARTGSNMWGFQRHDVVPDIVTMGKPMGNGHPVAGLVAQPHVLKTFGEQSRYFNTFGGNPVSCAAALAVLNVIKDEGLQENSARIGKMLRDGYRTLAEKFALIGDVRGDGLFLGVELVTDRQHKTPAREETNRMVNEMRREHVLISATGPFGNILKIRPPICFTEANAQQLLETSERVLTRLR